MLTTTFNALLENTFNQVSDIFDEDFGELGMDEEGIEHILVTLDSRLDADSVLIEDINLDIDESTISNNFGSDVVKTEDSNVPNKVIKSEFNLDSDEIEKDTFCPLQRDRCNTWPRQIQER